MSPEWITAAAAVLGLLGGGISVYVSMRGRITALEIRIDSMDRELGRVLRQVMHIEAMLTAVLSHAKISLQDIRGDL